MESNKVHLYALISIFQGVSYKQEVTLGTGDRARRDDRSNLKVMLVGVRLRSVGLHFIPPASVLPARQNIKKPS